MHAPRPHLRLPLAIAALLLGSALLLLVFRQPEIALAVVALSLLIVIAIVRDLIFGDR